MITRRETFSTILGAAISRYFPDTPPPPKTNSEVIPHKALWDKSTALLRHHDVVIYAPDNHDRLELYEPLTSVDYWDHLRKSGVTDYYDEFVLGEQETAQRLLFDKGNSTTDAFVADVRHRIETSLESLYGKKHKNSWADAMTRYERSLETSALKFAAAHAAGVKVHLTDTATWDDIVYAGSLKSLADKIDFVRKRLISNDPIVARNIADTRRGKAFVCYNESHVLPMMPELDRTNLPGNIDDALRSLGVKCATILVTENPAAVKTLLQKWASGKTRPQELPYGNGLNVPDYIYSPPKRSGIDMAPRAYRYPGEERNVPEMKP